jgi:acyl-CoA synthetase (AMP-forming)/AMP-acid ligase II
MDSFANSGGENIYPPEIEERMLHHPAIHDESIVGVKDAKYGEVVAGFLKIREGHEKPSLQEVRLWVQQVMGRHKAPNYIFWVGTEEKTKDYPITGSGKIRKDLLSIQGSLLINERVEPRKSKL